MGLKLTPLLLLASIYLCAFFVQLGDAAVVQPFTDLLRAKCAEQYYSTLSVSSCDES
jgi:hypothetical protein